MYRSVANFWYTLYCTYVTHSDPLIIIYICMGLGSRINCLGVKLEQTQTNTDTLQNIWSLCVVYKSTYYNHRFVVLEGL